LKQGHVDLSSPATTLAVVPLHSGRFLRSRHRPSPGRLGQPRPERRRH
jgi:hypothetical protein